MNGKWKSTTRLVDIRNRKMQIRQPSSDLRLKGKWPMSSINQLTKDGKAFMAVGFLTAPYRRITSKKFSRMQLAASAHYMILTVSSATDCRLEERLEAAEKKSYKEDWSQR